MTTAKVRISITTFATNTTKTKIITTTTYSTVISTGTVSRSCNTGIILNSTRSIPLIAFVFINHCVKFGKSVKSLDTIRGSYATMRLD